MSFIYQLNGIFNQRLDGLTEEERINLEHRKQMIIIIYNSFHGRLLNNNIGFEVTISGDYEIPNGEIWRRNADASEQFHYDLVDIFDQRRGERPDDWDGTPDDFDDLRDQLQEDYNSLALRWMSRSCICIDLQLRDLPQNNDNVPQNNDEPYDDDDNDDDDDDIHDDVQQAIDDYDYPEGAG